MAEATTTLDAVYRALAWLGYAGLAGTLAVLLVLWPEGVRQRRLALVALGGSTLLTLATIGWLVARPYTGAEPGLPRVEGAAAIARLAVLAAVGGFFTDLFDGPVRGVRRWAAAVAVLTLTATMLAGASGGPPGGGGAALTGDVFVAVVATVCGACLAVAAVVVPGDAWADVSRLGSRVAETGVAAIGAAALSGAVHAIAVERSAGPLPGGLPPLVLVLLLMALTVAAVLGLGRVLRTARRDAPVPVAVPVTPARPAEPAVEWFAPVQVARRPAVEVYEGPRRTTAATAPPRPGEQPLVVVLPDTAAAREDTDAVREDTDAVREDTDAEREDAAAEREDAAAAREGNAAARQGTAAARQDTAAARQDTAAVREDTAAAREDTAAAREDTGAAREDTGAAREDTDAAREDTDAAREEQQVEVPAAGATPAPAAGPEPEHQLEPEEQPEQEPAAVDLTDDAVPVPVPVPTTESASASAPGRARPVSPAARALRARRVAGLGRLVLPDDGEPPPVTRTVRVAGTVEPVVVVLPESRTSAPGRG